MSNTNNNAFQTTCKEVGERIAEIKAEIDNLSNSQQMEMLRLQSLSNKRNEAFDVMTNFVKKMADNRDNMLGNMRNQPPVDRSIVDEVGTDISGLDLLGLNLEEALMLVQANRTQLLEVSLQSQLDSVNQRNQKISELNEELAMVQAKACVGSAAGQAASAIAVAAQNGLATVIYGDLSTNLLFGSHLAETIYGGTMQYDPQDGDDVIIAGAGDDVVYGNGGNDHIFGDEGDDVIHGGLGNDTIFGDAGNDLLTGSYGHDFIVGGAGNDTIYGGYNTDVIGGDDGDDLIFGGNGIEDTLDAGDLIFGGNGNDTIYGNGGADSLFGDDGDDLMFGGIDNDMLIGGNGNDTLIGGSGNDLLVGGRGADHYYGGSGADLFVFGLDDLPATGTPLAVDIIHDFEVGVDKLNFELARTIQSVLSYVNNEMTVMEGIKMLYAGTAGVHTQFAALKWMGDATFTGLSGVYTRSTHEGTLVQVEATGDGIFDYAILLKGVSSISASDVML